MTPEQRERLVPLLHLMRQTARRQHRMNDYNRIHNLCDDLRDFLDCNPSDKTAEEWIEIAERETNGVEVDEPAAVAPIPRYPTDEQIEAGWPYLSEAEKQLPDYYVSGPYIDGSMSVCEVATARIVHKFRLDAVPAEPSDEPCNGCPWDDRCEECPARTPEPEDYFSLQTAAERYGLDYNKFCAAYREAIQGYGIADLPSGAGGTEPTKEEIQKAFFALPQRGDWMPNLNWFTHGVNWASQRGGTVEPSDVQKAETRFLNLALDIRRVIGWETPLNDFDVVTELQEYIQSLAGGTAQAADAATDLARLRAGEVKQKED